MYEDDMHGILWQACCMVCRLSKCLPAASPVYARAKFPWRPLYVNVLLSTLAEAHSACKV